MAGRETVRIGAGQVGYKKSKPKKSKGVKAWMPVRSGAGQVFQPSQNPLNLIGSQPGILGGILGQAEQLHRGAMGNIVRGVPSAPEVPVKKALYGPPIPPGFTRAALPSGGGAPNGTVGSPAPTPVASGGGSSTSTGSTSSRRPPATKVPKYKQPLPGPDQIELMIRGALQQSRRLTDQYAGQNEAIRQAVVADAQKLGAQAGSFQGQTAANTGLSATDAQAKSYVDLINAVGGAQSNQVASEIGNQGNILQQALGGYGSQAQRGHVEYGRQLRAQEPGLRQEAQAAQAKIDLDLAAQQLLRDKMTSEQKLAYDKLNAQNKLGYASLEERASYHQGMLDLNKRKAEISLADKKAKAATAGLKLDAAKRKTVSDWLKTYASEEVYATDSMGNRTGKKTVPLKNVPYTEVLEGLGREGIDPTTAYQVAISYSLPSIKAKGPVNFYRELIQNMTSRQAIKYVGQAFGPKVANKIKRNKNAIQLVSPVPVG